MEQLTHRQVQLGQLSVLKKLDRLCKELNLRYFLFYGTLLGAVRHQGFIPWDDDIDIGMPREDYEKLLGYLLNNEDALYPYKAISHRNNPEYIYPICRFCDTRYYIDYQGAKEYGLGLFVDIYPFDGYGNTEQERDKLYRKNWSLNKLVFQAGADRFHKSETAAWRTPLKLFYYGFAKTVGCKRFLAYMDREARKRGFDDDRYTDCVLWLPTRTGYPRALFDEFVLLPFEDGEFPVPAAYDEILTIRYGDYMQLPPAADQIAHHYYTAYRLTEEEVKQRDGR